MKNVKMALMTMLAMGMLTGCGSKTIDLNEYVTVGATGYDTVGEWTYSFDVEKFDKDWADKMKLSDSMKELYGTPDSMSEKNEILNDAIELCVSRKCDRMSGLSNGDVITVSWSCDAQEFESMVGLKLECEDIKYTVSDLKEVAELDPFTYLDVNFYGVSPLLGLEMKLDDSHPEVQDIHYEIKKENGYSTRTSFQNGDVVIIKAYTGIPANEFANKYGSVLSVYEKEYVVESASYYATKAEEIPEETLQEMIAVGEKAFDSYVNEIWSYPETLHSRKYIGNYFYSTNGAISLGGPNYVYLIYEVEAEHPVTKRNVHFYYPVCFGNMIMQEDGSMAVNLDDYSVPEANGFFADIFCVDGYYYCGFQTMEKLENYCNKGKNGSYDVSSTLDTH